MAPRPLIDRYGRPLTNLRIMVTPRCNFRCFFCHMEGYNSSGGAELSLEEVGLLAEAGRRLGIRGYKLTGGEPTLRGDIVEITRILASTGAKVSMTTNASLLDRHLEGLVDAGIEHLNISLHSLRKERFKKITGYPGLERVLENTRRAAELVPVKLNVVVLKGINEDEVEDFVELAARLQAKLQFIELHPVGKGARVTVFREHHLPWFQVLSMLKNRVEKIDYRYGLHNRPILVLDNGVEIELVGPVGNPAFCAACTRIRVSYDFKLIPCLNWRGKPVDVREALSKTRGGWEDRVEAVIGALQRVVEMRKPFYLCPFSKNQQPPRPRRPWRTARLGMPKRGGRLVFTGPRADKHLELYLSEWAY